MADKEKYFSPETIDIKAQEMLLKIKKTIGRTKKQNFIPEKSALIIIDMQNYFCNEQSHAFVTSVDSIIPKIKKLLNSYKIKNLPVIFTRHVDEENKNCQMNKWWKNSIASSSLMSRIIPELNINDSYLITKSQYDAFYNTDLEVYLKRKDISQLVITGVTTHLCCETTTRSAFVRGFETFFCVDSTATYNENFHTSAMLNLGHGFSNLTLSDEICRDLNNEKN